MILFFRFALHYLELHTEEKKIIKKYLPEYDSIIILKDTLIEGNGPKIIADKNNWANSTVTYKLDKIMQKIRQVGKNDREETNTIIGLIKKYLSKTDY